MALNVTGDTCVLTAFGPLPIGNLGGFPVDVWDGQRYAKKLVRSAGLQTAWRISFNNGTHLDCTRDDPIWSEGALPEDTILHSESGCSPLSLLLHLQAIGVRSQIRNGRLETTDSGYRRCRAVLSTAADQLGLTRVDELEPVFVEDVQLLPGKRETFGFPGSAFFNGLLVSCDA